MEYRVSDNLREDFLRRGFTRRHLGRLATVISAGATLPFFGEAALAQSRASDGVSGLVKINSNENPLGPCEAAVAAVQQITRQCGYYLHQTGRSVARTFAELEDLRPDYVRAYAGSSDPLFRTVAAYASPARGLVTADTTFEAAGRVAEFLGAKVTTVPLRQDWSHDVNAMLKTDTQAGLFYVCNPNNPSGTLTSREDIENLVDHVPTGAIVLLDEAYIHYPGIEDSLGLVRRDKDVIVLRTFSKIYGMAGLRCGFAVGRPDLLERIQPFGTGFLPATGMVAGEASLRDKDVVLERRRLFRGIREDVYEFLDKQGIGYVPGVANFFMLDAKKDARTLVNAMREQNVLIGRVWPAWPRHARVTIGTKSEMEVFKKALLKAMAH
jgi:histidinol-phosphate aminotransferase